MGTRTLLVGALAFTAVMSVGLGASAGADDPGSAVISACAHERTGALRISEDCRPPEEPLAWNVAGPAGPPGPSELAVSLRETTGTFTVAPKGSGPPNGVASACEAGETVLSGGTTAGGADLLPLELFSTGPTFDGNRSGWNVSWVNPTDQPVTASATVAALCVPGTLSNG